MTTVDHIAGQTFHARRGTVENAFRYGVDYVLVDAETGPRGPLLFSRNGRNVTSLWDRDHGGPPGKGTGSAWVRDVLAAHDISLTGLTIELLAQPRVLGHVFNPVSFWLCRDRDKVLRVVIAEVSNTYGDRHSYLCQRAGLEPIRAEDRIEATKIFHVSPFQPIAGTYRFSFDIRPHRLHIKIDFDTPGGGMIATLTGRRQRLTNFSIVRALLRRPFGSRRVLGLIHWQALKLWMKGAQFRARPLPPTDEVTR